MNNSYCHKIIKLNPGLSDETVKNILIKVLNHPEVKHAHAFMRHWKYYLCIVFSGMPVVGLIEEHYMADHQIPTPQKAMFIEN